MKTLLEYYNEIQLINACLQNINESKDPIKLPYTFDVYNEGPKNKDYKIAKANIYKIFFNIEKQEFEKEDGEKVVKFVDHYDQMICLPLPADKITYKTYPTKENTKDWTEIPSYRKIISHAPSCMYIQRIAGIRLYFFTKSSYMNVNCSLVA